MSTGYAGPYRLAVALRKESVDRNCEVAEAFWTQKVSLSARRAWIEIAHSARTSQHPKASLSARRAWIEIYKSI